MITTGWIKQYELSITGHGMYPIQQNKINRRTLYGSLKTRRIIRNVISVWCPHHERD